MSSVIHPMQPEHAWFRRQSPRKAAGARRRHLGPAIADTCYITLRMTGWLLMTGLATLGVFTLFFLMLGNFTALGFFSQVANLGTRFVAADEARRAAFMGQARVVIYLAASFTALMRWPLLFAILDSRKGPRHG